MSEWIKTEDLRPLIGEPALIFHNDAVCFAELTDRTRCGNKMRGKARAQWLLRSDDYNEWFIPLRDVTHWMPAPRAPQP